MKVAVVSDTYLPQKNGVVVFLQDFLQELSKNAEAVVLVPNEKNTEETKTNGKTKIYLLPSVPFPLYEGYRMSTAHRKDIKRIFVEEKVDVVHLHAPVLLGLKAFYVAKKMGLPVIVTYHTHFPDYVSHLSKGLLRGKLEDIAKMPVKRLVKEVFSKADVITVPTRTIMGELRNYGLKGVVPVPNGIDFSKFANKKGIDVRKKHRIPKRAGIILYVGRISFEKRIDVLLNAFKKTLDAHPSAYLIIAGSGPYLNHYKKLAEAMGLKNVVFAGFVPDDRLQSYYKAADIFASASDTETFGLTFVEAMHFGLPTVGVNKLGTADIIAKDTGLLAEPGNVADLARCISLLLDYPELRKKLGKNAKKKAKEFEIRNITKRFLEIYKKSIKNRKKP